MRVALEKGVEVVSVNDPFIDLDYMVGTIITCTVYRRSTVPKSIREGQIQLNSTQCVAQKEQMVTH